MGKLISVIVPIYKVEKYLTRCLNSIINQTYRNLEIILVNDGSPDTCPQICENYAMKDSRIKVIHQKNAGLSAARNSGINVATGELIAFIDSDDYIDLTMFEVLYNIMLKHNSDVAVCGFNKIREEDYINLNNSKEIGTVFCNSGVQSIENLLLDNKPESGIYWVESWNKLYKRELFEDIRFPVGKIHEDNFVMHHIYDKANIVCYTTEKLYNYLLRENSITSKTYNLKRHDDLEAFENRMLFLKRKGYEDLYIKSVINYLDSLIKHYGYTKRFFPNNIEIIRELRKKYCEVYKNIGEKGINKKKRIKFDLFFLSPNIYRCINAFKKP